MHGEAVEHARLSNREVGDVDHLLHFAVAFGLDLAHLEADQAAEEVLLRAQRLAHETDGFAAARRGNVAPGDEGGGSAVHHALVVVGAGCPNARDDLAGSRVDGVDERRVGGGVPLRARESAQIDGSEAETR